MREPKGVSLIELIVYVALASLILVGLGVFTIDIMQGRNKVFLLDKNERSARLAFHHLIREIEKGISINTGSSVFGSHPGVLSVQQPDASLSPTVFDVSGGRLRLTQGSNPAEFLTPSNITVSNLVFTNLSSGVSRLVRVEMTLVTDTADGDVNFTASDSFTTSILLRN